MNTKKVLFLALGLVVVFLALALVVWGLGQLGDDDSSERDLSNDGFGIASFEECVEAGYAVMESFPRQCRTPDGTVFVENVGVQPESGNEENEENEEPFLPNY